MHQALEVSEIFQLILHHIYSPKQTRFYRSRDRNWHSSFYPSEISTINSLAQTCKYFSHPSLDVLWYYQTDLEPLLRCLPEDVWEYRARDDASEPCPEQLTLRRPLLKEDFKRVDSYARRICVLGDPESVGPIPTREEEGVDVMIYPIIVSRRSLWGLGPLLPNLIELKIGLEHFCNLAWYPRLAIGSQLQFVNIAAFREDIEDLGAVYDIHWDNVLALLSPALPCLTSLSFSAHVAYSNPMDGDIYLFDEHEKGVPLKIIQTIVSPTVLNIISVPLDAVTIRHISHLQTVEVLAISIINIKANDPLVTALPELPNLLELCVQADDPNFCSILIRQLGPNRMRALKVIRAETSQYLWDLDQFIESLRASRFVATIEGMGITTPTYERRPNPDMPSITRDTIDQLSHFKKLRIIRLFLNGEVHLDLESLETVASLWPNLEVLDLPSRTRLGPIEPELSLNNLLVVSTKLPFLKEVSLQVDATEELMYVTSGLPISGIASSELEILDVCTTPVYNFLVEEVATLLGAAFPNLRRFSYGWKWPDRSGREPLQVDLSIKEEMSLAAWKRVEKMLPLQY